MIRSRGIRISATGLSPPPGSLVRARRMAAAEAPVQRTDHGRPLEEAARNEQRLRGSDVQAREQDAVAVLAALGDDLREQVELRKRVLERQPEHPEPPLLLRSGRTRSWAAKPCEKRVRAPVDVAPPGDQDLLDPRERRR